MIPIKKTENGIEALTIEEGSSGEKKVEFLSFAVRAAFDQKLVPKQELDKYGGKAPYDLYLPSVQNKISKRVCKNCNKYHATLKSLGLHKKTCKKSR